MKIYQVIGKGQRAYTDRGDAIRAARERAAETGHTTRVDLCHFEKLDKRCLLALFNPDMGSPFERVRVLSYVPHGEQSKRTGLWKVKRVT